MQSIHQEYEMYTRIRAYVYTYSCMYMYAQIREYRIHQEYIKNTSSRPKMEKFHFCWPPTVQKSKSVVLNFLSQLSIA